LQMGESREKYSDNDMRLMVNHVYSVCSSTDYRHQKIAEAPKGNQMWQELEDRQRLARRLTYRSSEHCAHSVSSMTTKYARYLSNSMHRVVGVDAEKVLFIYKRYGTKHSSAAQNMINCVFRKYIITFIDGKVFSYDKKRKATSADTEEEEEEE
ncbi:hypothetical protein PFISCL1PPCAC_17776, partial [Pristionchus fissidentatus]